jgi:hypothetical protein
VNIRLSRTSPRLVIVFAVTFVLHFTLTFVGMPTWASVVDRLYRSVGHAPASFSTTEVVVSSCVQLLSLPLLFTRQLAHAAFFWSDVQRGIFPQIARLAANSLIHAFFARVFMDYYSAQTRQGLTRRWSERLAALVPCSA